MWKGCRLKFSFITIGLEDFLGWQTQSIHYGDICRLKAHIMFHFQNVFV